MGLQYYNKTLLGEISFLTVISFLGIIKSEIELLP